MQISRIPNAYVGLTRDDASVRFPGITFWDCKDFKKAKENQNIDNDAARAGESKPARGSVRMKEGENVMMDFVELEDGKIIDGLTAKLIRDELRSTCHELHKKDLLSRNWTSIGITARSFVFAHIYAKFPYLMLCHNDWKVNAIVGPIISQWWVAEDKRVAKRTRVPLKSVRVKIEKDVCPKRSSPDSESPNANAPSPKRQRLMVAAPLSPPSFSPQNVDSSHRQPTPITMTAQPVAAVAPAAAIAPPAAVASAVVPSPAAAVPTTLISTSTAPVTAQTSKTLPRTRRANPL